MACKLPVVSNRAGVNEQIVLHGQTGYLVDEQMPWSKAIVDLANNSQLRTQMGQAGYQRVRQDYDIQAVAKRMIRYLSESS
jgi:glycosyltransferase involved in cell wall biosynthesis